MKSVTSLCERAHNQQTLWEGGGEGLIKFQNKWKQNNMKFVYNTKRKIIAWEKCLKPLVLRG
jgi:hypothetical protein